MVNTHFTKTLFSKDKKDNIRVWNIYVVEKSNKQVFVKRVYGIRGKKMTTVEKQIKAGKNIGKSNETTLIQQGISEAQSVVEKQRDMGYVDDESNIPNHDQVFLPMLADEYTKHCKKLVFPVFVQRKIDGIRLLIGKQKGVVKMMTRTGKEVHFLDHIKDEIEVFIPENTFLDGEIYSDERSFEEISGEFRKEQPSGTDMKFHVFDCFNTGMMTLTVEQRFNWLYDFFVTHSFQYTLPVETEECLAVTDVDTFHDRYVVEGFEGLILRNKNSPYELNTRSKHLQKYKKFHTEEYEIIGVQAGSGRDEGTAIFICQVEPDKIFRARPKGTIEYRKELYTRRKDIVGKFLTVKYQELSADGIPRFPVGISIRDYE